MYEWNETVQKMIDWIENNICENPSLIKMSKQIGYSSYYCSVQFHKISGMTIKSYISNRRLALATIELRDTSKRIIDIAIKYGYSSQEAFTRAFSMMFECTPASYRRNPVPIPIPIHKVVYFPEHYRELYRGGNHMSNANLINANVRIEYIPAHKYIGIWDKNVDNYCDFWKRHDCDTVSGLIDSLNHVSDLIVSEHTAGWYYLDGNRRYFYGMGVPLDYDGEIPDGFEIKEFPSSYYLVFFHPPFDYLKDCDEVMSKVENLAWNYDIQKNFRNGKYTWNEDVCQCYQRCCPEILGYEILRPIKKIEK